ncbi:lysophospholipid transporter LplT [Limnohabitans sp. T6-20]|uniref:lysophospholipid transporter LplT n=1 Tax=Limnohabitans sp. T6-20 TaxID=1100725 RepID=UPI000D3BCFAF|nr:lysophospholipid transporter LplT [Limnohabitans sp. T6-20]PUE08109.1 lysophospholipid transporter LplT [Limnohabitans sp. T6-20]
MPKGFYLLILAQFASGLADNALMILGVCFLQEQGHPGWWSPLLKFSFTLSYVVLAGVVGPIADAFPKGRLMASMNMLKLAGVVLLLCGVHPFFGFALAGLAAAVYAPAKYALVTESVPASLLVKANAWLEVSVVLSVLLGVALGGWLTGWHKDPWINEAFAIFQDLPPQLAPTQIFPAFVAVCLIYIVSSGLNMGLNSMDARGTRHPLTWHSIQWPLFWKNNRQLWADPLGGVSLYVTTLSWGVGAVLQFAVLAWAQTSAGLSLQHGAYLQALVAVGVISGAVMAANVFQIFNAHNALPWGLVLAVLLPCMALTTSLWLAVPLLILAGCAGGMLLVPMNALLQHRGQKILTSGRSIAVQGFNENLSVLLMLGTYSVLLAWQVPLLSVMLLLMLPLLAAVMPWRLKIRWPLRAK